MSKQHRYPDQFKREAVELVKFSGKPVARIAKDLGIADQTLRNWMKQAEPDGNEELSSGEREELKALRSENRTLKMEREILKKAAAFFAAENDRK